MSSADLPAAAPSASCPSHAARGDNGRLFQGPKGRRDAHYCIAPAPSPSSRRCGGERPAPAVPKISSYEGHAGKHNCFFLKKLAFPVRSVSPWYKIHLAKLGRAGHWVLTCSTGSDSDSVK